jgi:hypothetical protein
MQNSTKRARRPLGLPRPQPQRPGPFWSRVEKTVRVAGSRKRVENNQHT